jgi:cytochrome c-type biogenesis protein CcmH/NrfG
LRLSSGGCRRGSAGRVLPLLALAAVLLASCRKDPTLEALRQMEDGQRKGQELSASRIRELKEDIRRYQGEVQKKVNATGQLGVYYKLLALEYMKQQMYQSAYDALKEAQAIHPENPILFYYAAVCAARMAKAQVESDAQGLWNGRAEALYQRALALDPGYEDALYGLAVLDLFELDRGQEAEALLDRILAKDPRNTEARFLLANLYSRTGRPEQAAEQYGVIAENTKAKAEREQALENQRRIEEELHGQR